MVSRRFKRRKRPMLDYDDILTEAEMDFENEWENMEYESSRNRNR